MCLTGSSGLKTWLVVAVATEYSPSQVSAKALDFNWGASLGWPSVAAASNKKFPPPPSHWFLGPPNARSAPCPKNTADQKFLPFSQSDGNYDTFLHGPKRRK